MYPKEGKHWQPQERRVLEAEEGRRSLRLRQGETHFSRTLGRVILRIQVGACPRSRVMTSAPSAVRHSPGAVGGHLENTGSVASPTPGTRPSQPLAPSTHRTPCPVLAGKRGRVALKEATLDFRATSRCDTGRVQGGTGQDP